MKKNIIKHIAVVAILLISINLYSQQSDTRPGNWASKISAAKFKNLYKVNDTIYRSEQPDSLGFVAINKMGVKSVLSLRSSHSDTRLVYKLPLKLYNVKMAAEQITDDDIVAALWILKNSPKPVIVHCAHGSDRTGAVLAMYRIIFQNWTKEQAITEMKEGGYGFHKTYINISHYINKVDVERIKQEVYR